MATRDPDSAPRFSIAILIKLIRALRWQHQLFVFVVLLQCVYLISNRIIQLALYTDWGGGISSTRAAVWFCGIIILAVVFVAYYAIHAILTVNLIELIVFRVLTVWLLVRCIVGYATSSGDCDADARNTCLGFLVVEVVINIATFALSISALEDLRWKRYKAVGAEVQVRALYLRYELFSAFRKVDVQFSIVTLYTGILYTATSLDDNRTAQFALGASVALVPVEVVWDYFAKAAVRRADPYYVYAFWALSVFLPMFICSMTWDVLHENNVLGTATPEVLATVAVFSALALANRVGTVVCSVLLLNSFGSPQYPALQRLISGSRVSGFQRSRLRAPPPRKGRPASAKKDSEGPSAAGVVVANPMSVLPVAGQPPAEHQSQLPAGGPEEVLVDEWDDPSVGIEPGRVWADAQGGSAGMELELSSLPVGSSAAVQWR